MGKKKDKRLNTFENFALSGAAAVISKTTAAPIERVKLMIQNQDEMLKAGTLEKAYRGPLDCFRRILSEEGVAPLWRGNLANCLRYFPTQALNFAFKEKLLNICFHTYIYFHTKDHRPHIIHYTHTHPYIHIFTHA